MPVGERRARLGLRHHLAPPALVAEGGAGGVAAVAGDLLGLHATDPSAVFMQAIARMAEVSVDDVSAALYDDRTRLATYGPVTVADAKWWSGWTAADVKRALSVVGPVEVAFDDSGAPGWVLADDIEPVTAPEPWAALLAALDQAVMGWSGREWFLGEHRGPLFDRSGNVGPTVWWDGRIVGGWAQRNDGEVALERQLSA